MKALLGLIVVALLVVIALMAFGYIDVNQTREARLPRVEGGQLPAVDVDGPEVEVGTRNASIEVPTIKTEEKKIELPVVDVKKGKEE